MENLTVTIDLDKDIIESLKYLDKLEDLECSPYIHDIGFADALKSIYLLVGNSDKRWISFNKANLVKKLTEAFDVDGYDLVLKKKNWV